MVPTFGWLFVVATLLATSANAGETNADGIIPSGRSAVRELSGCQRVGMLFFVSNLLCDLNGNISELNRLSNSVC